MPRPTHRKRGSALSSDTTHTLPVYVPAAANDDDRPPDYSDSAEEADRDTDSTDSTDYVPPAAAATSFSLSSRRRRRFTSSAHRRRQSGKNLSSTDPFIDSLLARSVHALEMSNTLLQSSMSTQTALSSVFVDPAADDVLENSARGLARRIGHREWADDLAEISRGVDGLFDDAGAVSCSLPTRQASIYRLPSSIGARASASSLPLHAPLSSPKVTETLPEPATPAYKMLSSFVSASSSSPLTAIPKFSSPRASASPPTSYKSKLDTPPAEEQSSASSSSLTPCLAKRTVISLRKILDEQPPPARPRPLRAPAFLPRTPAPAAETATSTATASISRLYTKAKHTSSTRPPSPPRQSAMKQPQSMQALAVDVIPPAPAPTAFNFPALLAMRNWSTQSLTSLGAGSAPSSGRSTPRRITFAQLPESYKGPGSGRARKRGRGRGAARGRGRDDASEKEEVGGWWSTWFLGVGAGAPGLGAREERIEERLGRNWGGRMPGAPAGFGPGVDEWPI